MTHKIYPDSLKLELHPVPLSKYLRAFTNLLIRTSIITSSSYNEYTNLYRL